MKTLILATSLPKSALVVPVQATNMVAAQKTWRMSRHSTQIMLHPGDKAQNFFSGDWSLNTVATYSQRIAFVNYVLQNLLQVRMVIKLTFNITVVL